MIEDKEYKLQHNKELLRLKNLLEKENIRNIVFISAEDKLTKVYIKEISNYINLEKYNKIYLHNSSNIEGISISGTVIVLLDNWYKSKAIDNNLLSLINMIPTRYIGENIFVKYWWADNENKL